MARRVGTGRALAEGVYEHLVTEELARALGDDGERRHELALVDEVDAHQALARHVGREVERVLAGLRGKDRVEQARALVGEVLDYLATRVTADVGEALGEQRLEPPTRRLLAVHRGTPPLRPHTALAQSTLLTRNRAEPTLGHELAREVASADRIDAIVAFVTVGGVRQIIEQLEPFARRGGALRILTTTFTGTTEVAALDLLARLPGAEVRVSYDTRRTRLHAKAWLFHRSTGLSTAYVGSANLTSTALEVGQEWMVKVAAVDLPHVADKFAGTFETLWAEPEFERYHPDHDGHRARLQRALNVEAAPSDERHLVTLQPFPYQVEILDRLEAERAVHGRRRNLVVAATGTGKTVIAAFDYQRQVMRAGVAPRLLFLAHREELLEQARRTFRYVLQDASFGELLTGGHTPSRWEHVFATIQSAASRDLAAMLGPAHFRHVVLDECHHAPASSYQAVMTSLTPDLLVGLTATPERSDNRSLLPDFDGHVAAELRLWHALDDQLLVPFEYYGIADGTDLRRVRWSRAGYDAGALGDLYTGNDARATLIRAQLARRVSDVRKVRALGFCVSVAHAEFMAQQFTAAGIPALAVHGGTPDEVRADAPRRLRERELNVLFACDLYNEGVDLPFVDTLLLLRPTQSATLFMQQLGRGLRHHVGPPAKRSCLVLDFIGQHRDEFRFDTCLAAMTGVPRARLRRDLEQGFPYLPSGCSLVLDEVARDEILRSLRSTLAGANRLAAELRELTAADGARPRLGGFLAQTGRELADVYAAGGWTALLAKAGLAPALSDDEADLSRRLGWLQHIDEPGRLHTYRDAVAAAVRGQVLPLTPTQRTQLHMLGYQLNHRGVLQAAEATAAYVAARPAIAAELEELHEVLVDRVALADEVRPVPEWALTLHRHYTRREIVAGVGFVTADDKGAMPQGGVLEVAGDRELLFVTLDKSGRSFSPTTRYRDYAESPTVFHWESQAAASVSRPSGRRYIESPGNGRRFFLFVRAEPDAPFAFLGEVHYLSHQGDRPIAIRWQLARPMPAALYERYATLRPR